MTISLEPKLPWASSNLPENFGRADLSPVALKFPSRKAGSVPLFGFAPGDAYPAICVTTDAVGSYPTISPLPAHGFPCIPAVYFLWRSCRITPPGRYPAPRPLESGLSSRRRILRAATRPTPTTLFIVALRIGKASTAHREGIY